MKAGYIVRNQYALHFLTFTVVDWVDVFTRKIYRDIVLDSFKYCQEQKGLILKGYVVMSNHIHLLAQSKEGKLSDSIRDFKKFTAQMILKQMLNNGESRSAWMLKRFEFAAKSNSKNSEYQFWQVGNHPEEIYSEKFFWTKLNYIHMNPIRLGIVSKASDYLYSSASNYVGKESLINITLGNIPTINPLARNGYDADISLW